MTTLERLRARKRDLVQQLDSTNAADERERIERQIEQITIALDLLDPPAAEQRT